MNFYEVIFNVKILAKVKDLNLNSMLLALISEALDNEDYKKIIRAYTYKLKN